MASVFLAHDANSGRAVALKLMDPALRGIDGSFVDRFMQEARSSAELHHPNVVELVSYGEEAGWHYLATEYVEGGTVGRLLRTMGVFPPVLAAELLAQLLAGLAHSHERGVVHRDLKPENLLLTASGVLKIADFGIAKTADQTRLTQTGMMVGTAGYMSPEQARGRPLDGRSDLFSAGAILYELLTGQGPFACDNAAASITRILSCQFAPVFSVNPGVLGPLEQVLDRMLQLEPHDRFASAAEALEALRPMVEEARLNRPHLVAQALQSPLETRRALEVEAAAKLLLASRVTLEGASALTLNQAALKAHLALTLDPDNADAKEYLDELGRRTRLNFGVSNNPRIAELERQLEAPHVNPVLFTQLAQLYRLEGNPLKAVGFLKSYLRARPNDAYVSGQLAQLLGGERGAPALAIGAQTRELMAGIRTGGFKAGQRAGAVPPAPDQGATGHLSNDLGLPVADTQSPLVTLARKWGPALILIVSLGLAARWVIRKTDQLANESVALSGQLQKNLQAQAPVEPVAPVQVDYDRQFAAALDKAVRLDQQGENDAAIAAYEEVMANFPKRPQTREAAFRRAKLLVQVGRNSVAKDAFGAFLERYPASPDAPEALLRRGEAAAANLLDAEAEADLTQFLERHAAHALVPEAWVVRGELFARRGASASAKADLEAALARLGPSALRDRAEAAMKTLPP